MTYPLKRLRQLAGLSQAELARVIGVSRHTVYSWECGRRQVPAAMWALTLERVPRAAKLLEWEERL